jgi:molecular chaperone HscB
MTELRAQKISTHCWKCREPVTGPVCSSCATIRPPPADADLFDVLGLPRLYFFERSALDQAFRQVSRKVHPDRYARKSAVERRMSLQWTALVNEARRILLDPISRARYLATGDTAPPEEGGPVLDPEFLEDIFDMQMAAAADPDGVRARAGQLRDALLAELDDTFARWEADDGDLLAVPERLARLKYLNNILTATAG